MSRAIRKEAPHCLLAAGETGRPSIAAFKSKAVIEARERNGQSFRAAFNFGCGIPYLAVPEIFEHGLKWLTHLPGRSTQARRRVPHRRAIQRLR